MHTCGGTHLLTSVLLAAAKIGKERGRQMTENETEAHVFTLTERAASELHGNGEYTFSVEKAPP